MGGVCVLGAFIIVRANMKFKFVRAVPVCFALTESENTHNKSDVFGVNKRKSLFGSSHPRNTLAYA